MSRQEADSRNLWPPYYPWKVLWISSSLAGICPCLDVLLMLWWAAHAMMRGPYHDAWPIPWWAFHAKMSWQFHVVLNIPCCTAREKKTTLNFLPTQTQSNGINTDFKKTIEPKRKSSIICIIDWRGPGSCCFCLSLELLVRSASCVSGF